MKFCIPTVGTQPFGNGDKPRPKLYSDYQCSRLYDAVLNLGLALGEDASMDLLVHLPMLVIAEFMTSSWIYCKD